jgi:uncharacterized protein YacL
MSVAESPVMVEQLRIMPNGVRVFLVYGFAVLAMVGLTLPLVVAEAVETPISPLGIVDMLLLAYLIFTLTLVLQRKQAGYGLALGLASLSVPFVAIMYLAAGTIGALIALIVAVLVFWSLRRPASRGWFIEP